VTDILIDPEKLASIDLEYGGHRSRDDGLCLLEAVAYLAGELHTDKPRCVSPILGEFGRTFNDCIAKERRQDLKPLLPFLIGSAPDGPFREDVHYCDEAGRAWMINDWGIRTVMPMMLDVMAASDLAARLRSLDPVNNGVALQSCLPLTNRAAAWTVRAVGTWQARGASRHSRTQPWVQMFAVGLARANDYLASWMMTPECVPGLLRSMLAMKTRDHLAVIEDGTRYFESYSTLSDEILATAIDLVAEMAKSPWDVCGGRCVTG
jgi:hypothetical protein